MNINGTGGGGQGKRKNLPGVKLYLRHSTCNLSFLFDLFLFAVAVNLSLLSLFGYLKLLFE